jgi:hypothetical protein
MPNCKPQDGETNVQNMATTPEVWRVFAYSNRAADMPVNAGIAGFFIRPINVI